MRAEVNFVKTMNANQQPNDNRTEMFQRHRQPLTRLRVELAHRAVVTRGWGKGEESNFELVYFKLALLQIAIETIVCRLTVISKKKIKSKIEFN